MATAGVVLCGGASRRMGRDKALIEVGGKPLVQLVAEHVARVAEPVMLASGELGRFAHLPYREIADPAPGAGPLSGLVAALIASPHDLVVAVAADMPFTNPELFRLLIDLRADEAAVVPVTDEGLQPLHALYHRDALGAMNDALYRGSYALRDVLQELRVRRVEQPEWETVDPQGRFALNINTEKDLRLLGDI